MTTNNNLQLQKKIYQLEFRKENFQIVYHNLVNTKTGEEFTTDELDDLNIAQVHNQYRSKYGIPFIDEIKAIKEQYGLSAAKISEILGLGPNVFKNYENGEMPSIATGRLIQLAKDPEEFRKLIALSKNELEPHELERINKKVAAKLSGWNEFDYKLEEYLFGPKIPSEHNGYKIPAMEKLGMMVKYFAQQLQPFTTKMNKLLFYADFLHYSRTGFSITGLTYIAITHGPVPKNYGGIYDRLFEAGFVALEEVDFNDFTGEKFMNQDGEPDMELFTATERKAIVDVEQQLGKLKTNQIVDISHDEFAWRQNIDDFGRISYDYGFVLKGV
jgi:transcriptional regulator with XRE-family HTH domain